MYCAVFAHVPSLSCLTYHFSKIRVDIPSIRELVSVISYDALQPDIIPDSVLYARTIGFSNGQSGSVLVASNSRLGRLNKFEDATGYKVRTNTHEQLWGIRSNYWRQRTIMYSQKTTSLVLKRVTLK